MANDSSTVVARVGLDDRGFQEGVAKIQRSLKVVQSEFAVASSKLESFGKSTDGLKLKAETLNKQIELQKDKVAALNKSFQESVEKKGADSKATENLKIKLNYATAELNKMQSELKNTTKELNEKSSTWYKLSQNMDKASSKMKSVGDKMVSAGKSLSTYVTAPILGIGIAATKMAMEAVESENLFDVSMGKMSNEARKWSEETSKALGLNSYSVRNNMATYNAMLTSMGLTSKESLKMSEGLTKLSYDMASFYNLKPEEAFNKLKSGISGEAEPLKALGILVNDNTIKTYAYANGIAKQGKELTESQKVQARYGAIMEATKKAQGDLARTMDSPTNKLRIMQEQVNQLGIKFGQLLIPVVDKLINIVSPLVNKFNGLSKEQQELIVKVLLVAATLGPLILVIGKMIIVVSSAISAFSTISGAVAAAGGVMAILTGPVAIAIAAITALIVIGVLLWKNWDKVKEVTFNAWNSMKNFFTKLGAWLKGFFSNWGSVILTALSPYLGIPITIMKNWDKISGYFENLKNSIKQKLKDMFNFELPHIKLPHFNLKGSFSIMPPSVPKFDVSWYDKGGIFNRPSIIGVGEKREEFVGALDDLRYLIRDELLKNSSNGGTQIIFQGNYSFSEKQDIDYFMNKAAQLIQRKVK